MCRGIKQCDAVMEREQIKRSALTRRVFLKVAGEQPWVKRGVKREGGSEVIQRRWRVRVCAHVRACVRVCVSIRVCVCAHAQVCTVFSVCTVRVSM